MRIMNVFSILIKLWPAIKDTLLGGLDLSFYLKRNRAIAAMAVCIFVTLLAFVYTWEQAYMHGAVSKALQQKITAMESKSK